MRPKEQQRAGRFDRCLRQFDTGIYPLPGISAARKRNTFVAQLIDSCRRVEFVWRIRDKPHSVEIADPSRENFDPIKAASYYQQQGNIEEASWLVFLLTHFGMHKTARWQLTRDIYSGLNKGAIWDWHKVNQNPDSMKSWISDNIKDLRSSGPCKFGNHRKYESLGDSSKRGTGKVIVSYVNWVKANDGNHESLFKKAHSETDGTSGGVFDYLYKGMSAVISFGRMGKFDYLTMLSKLGIADIEPSTPYMTNSTGPLTGAKLLFGRNDLSPKELQNRVVELAHVLDVNMQVIEDAICNWQKSPARYTYFSG